MDQHELHHSINQHTLNQHQLRIEIDEQHRLGFLNWLPLIVVILPNLAPIFFDGEPESWRRSIIFLLVVYFLYKISKAPWQLYASARTTRIFHQLGLTPSTKIIYPIQNHSHKDSLTELNRIEIGFLLLAMSSPAIGIGLLVYLQSKLDLGLDYLNSHSTVLFLLASLVKPLGHLHDRVLQRSRYLQSQLEFPTQSAEQFNESFENLAFKLNQLELESLNKTELMSFKKHQIDAKLMQISNKLSQFEKSDQLYQSNSFDLLAKLERTLAETRDKLEKTELSFNHLLFLNHHNHASPLDSISKVFTQILNPHERSEREKSHTRTAMYKQDAEGNAEASTRSDRIIPKLRRIEQQQSINPMQNSGKISEEMICNLFQITRGLETIKYGFEMVAHQILNGIRSPITTLVKILSCSWTFFLSFCLIISPIQILRSMTASDNQKISAPCKKSLNRDPRIRRLESPSCSSSLTSSSSSASSSEHQSPLLHSPTLHPTTLNHKIAHPHLARLDSSDPDSLYHLHH